MKIMIQEGSIQVGFVGCVCSLKNAVKPKRGVVQLLRFKVRSPRLKKANSFLQNPQMRKPKQESKNNEGADKSIKGKVGVKELQKTISIKETCRKKTKQGNGWPS